jgi:ketopantoate reductase
MYRLLLEEIAELARAEKVGLDEEIVNRVIKALDGAGAGALTSLYKDLIHGKRLELEALQGHAVRSASGTGSQLRCSSRAMPCSVPTATGEQLLHVSNPRGRRKRLRSL